MLVGYTHGNWVYCGTLIKGIIKSFDFCSSYPYVLTTQKFPMSEFRKINITKREQMNKNNAYLLTVRIKGLECKYYNTFISASKCNYTKGSKVDNGRLISADEIEITITDIDFYFYLDTYDWESYEIIECYYSRYDYLPIEYVNFILDKYENKTKFKNVEGKEDIYAIEKAKVNRTIWNDLY